jgi:hypothetical protein
MSKSSGRSWFGRKASGSVTVITANIERKYARNAKAAFWLTTFIVGLLSASILTTKTHPILALIVGGFLGTGCGAVLWVLVRLWPGIRRVWWWLPEALIGGSLLYGYTALAHTVSNVVLRTMILLAVVGVPAGIPKVRRFIWSWVMCLVVRHRLRTVFTDVIKTNAHGTLPLILLARPTPIGERVWILLRPGLSKTDISNRLELIATGCHATTVLVNQPGSNSAYLQLDIKRREALTETIASPLVDLIDPSTPAAARPAPVLPDGLNLADVPLIVKYVPGPRAGRKTPADHTVSPNGHNGSASDDDNEWL